MFQQNLNQQLLQVCRLLYIYKYRKWSMDGLCHSIITDMTKKAEERASYLRPSKTQRVSEKQVAERQNRGAVAIKDFKRSWHTIRIGSTPTFLYFELYLYSAYAAHYVYDYTKPSLNQPWLKKE